MNEFDRKAMVIETAVSPMVLEVSRQERRYGGAVNLFHYSINLLIVRRHS